MAVLNPTPFKLLVLMEHVQEMRAHVCSLPHEETCGILAGSNGLSVAVYAGENILHSATRFQMDPRRQLEILLDIERCAWEVAAVFHSHPNGEAYPSDTDVAELFDEDSAAIIWMNEEGDWRFKAYTIRNGMIRNLQIICNDRGYVLTDVV